jgi:hypothetical protein
MASDLHLRLSVDPFQERLPNVDEPPTLIDNVEADAIGVFVVHDHLRNHLFGGTPRLRSSDFERLKLKTIFVGVTDIVGVDIEIEPYSISLGYECRHNPRPGPAARNPTVRLRAAGEEAAKSKK